MSGFEPSRDDVVMLDVKESLVRGVPTHRINQLLTTLEEHLKPLSTSASNWIGDGVNCQFLKAQEVGGWKKGKMRLRVEIVPDEPEPSPDAKFLDELRKETNLE